MSSHTEKTHRAYQSLNAIRDISQLISDIQHKSPCSLPVDPLPVEFGVSEEGMDRRVALITHTTGRKMDILSGQKPITKIARLQGNIENYIGMSQIPTGVIGPVKVVGSAARGDYYVPLATSEGTLVASYHRGAKACYLAGGATSLCLTEGVQRSPVFKFKDLGCLGVFIVWVLPQLETFKSITEETSRYARLMEMKTNIEGNHLILTFEYTTGDASGQNMVTICTDAICQYILAHAPIQPDFWFVEGNYSGDKKATALSFTEVRGKKVTAEIILSADIVKDVLKTTPKAMAAYWLSSTLGVIQSGAIGAQGHYANGLAALFIATGQDVACVSEAAIGITRLEETTDGSLYASVTMPNLIIGTVGGGTSLPTQRECLELMECYGEGKSKKYAEICGAVILAGEISIAAALSAGHFTAAHKKFGRK
jgi:hydroxymethylglutaryl-CoA reductase (NADPH)